MGDDFAGYLDYHHQQHKTRFNVACVAAGDVLLLAWAPLAVFSRTRMLGGILLVGGGAITVLGHLVDRTLGPEVRGLSRHPLWHVRADIDLVQSRLFSPSI